MILGEDNRKRWSQMDVLVMQAFQQYKDETCPEHGGPIWLCRWDPEDPRLDLKLKPARGCYVAEEIRRHDEKRDKDADYEPVRPEFVWRPDEDMPLVKLRKMYYEQAAREASEDAED